MINYIGSKQKLLKMLMAIFNEIKADGSVSDLFSGSARVGYYGKQNGRQVFSNDITNYGYVLASAYVQADYEEHYENQCRLIKELNSLRPRAGYFTETFCIKSRYFQPKNGERIDAIREEIDNKCLDEVLKNVLLASLVEAADRVANTVGLYSAFLKHWSARSRNDLQLLPIALAPQPAGGPCMASRRPANEIAKNLTTDIAYLDPPYNAIRYDRAYHVLETIVLNDSPTPKGITCRRPKPERRDPLYAAKTALHALAQIVKNIQTESIVLSFSNEGHISRADIAELLGSRRKHLIEIKRLHKQHISGKLKKPAHKITKGNELLSHTVIEYTFVATNDQAAASRVRGLLWRNSGST